MPELHHSLRAASAFAISFRVEMVTLVRRHGERKYARSISSRLPDGKRRGVPILCDITRRSPKRDCATPARGECQRLTASHVNGQHAHGLRASDRRIA